MDRGGEKNSIKEMEVFNYTLLGFSFKMRRKCLSGFGRVPFIFYSSKLRKFRRKEFHLYYYFLNYQFHIYDVN